MKFEDIQEGDHVHDAGNPIVGGFIKKKRKASVIVHFCTGIGNAYSATYDREHCRLLVKE